MGWGKTSASRRGAHRSAVSTMKSTMASLPRNGSLWIARRIVGTNRDYYARGDAPSRERHA
jgi:hypothetical protein